MAEEFRVLRPREYHTQLVLKGHRADGRKLDEVREIKLETDAIRTADSSSLVKLGNTSIVCGCITQLVKNQDKNDEGDEVLKISVSLPPICSNTTTANNRSQNIAQLLSKLIYNIIEDSDCLDKKNLYLEQCDSHWLINIEVICLNYDGCLLDASIIAILSALKALTLSTKSRPDIPDSSINFNNIPICSSFAMIGKRIICDPNLEEETVAQCAFSITIDSTTNRLCQINKVGGKSLSPPNLTKCIQLAKERAIKFKSIIETVVNDTNSTIEMSIDNQ